MSDAWKILGLDPATADEKQVRSTYARLLKLNRPDQNPQGFQQLRQSYEHALQWLRLRHADADVRDDEPASREAEEPEVSAPSQPPPTTPARQEDIPPSPPPLPPSALRTSTGLASGATPWRPSERRCKKCEFMASKRRKHTCARL